MAHQGPTGDDLVRAKCPQTQCAWADAGRGIRSHQGPAGADGVQDKCAHHYKHEPRLSEAPWCTKATMVPMLCQPGAPSSTRQGPKLVQASARTKASLVLKACETGALRCTTMCLDCSTHLGNQWHHWCRCCPRQVPLDTQGMSRCWLRHPLAARPCWWRWCARQVPQVTQA